MNSPTPKRQQETCLSNGHDASWNLQNASCLISWMHGTSSKTKSNNYHIYLFHSRNSLMSLPMKQTGARRDCSCRLLVHRSMLNLKVNFTRVKWETLNDAPASSKHLDTIGNLESLKNRINSWNAPQNETHLLTTGQLVEVKLFSQIAVTVDGSSYYHKNFVAFL